MIHERLVAEYGFTGNYQRVKMFLAEARPRIAAALEESDDNPLSGFAPPLRGRPWCAGAGRLGRRGRPVGPCRHPARCTRSTWCSSHSRDPFCCFTTSMDLATFWDCHRRAFAHFGGVPGTLVYDRTKTVIRRHVAPGLAVPLHPEAAAFADHYGFTIDVLAAYRPTGKGRVERQVNIVRDHVIAGRSFDSIRELDGAFDAWLPIRRSQVHRTHGQVIAVRAQADRAALRGLPDQPYLVAEKHLRRVGKDCLISFEASCYSVPARLVRPGQRVQLQIHPDPDGDRVSIHALGVDGGGWLATHPRATRRGTWMIDQAHWDGLPDGHTRATTTETPPPAISIGSAPLEPLSALLIRRHADLRVAARPLTDYANLANPKENS